MDNGWWIRALAIAALAVLVGSAIGIGAYNAGVAHAVADGGRQVHWGHGFFPIFPLFFFFFFFVLMRGLWWGGRWGRGWGPGWGYGYRYRDGVPPAFEEWHRRAHANDAAAEVMKQILVVDDEPRIAEICRDYLERAGFKVHRRRQWRRRPGARAHEAARISSSLTWDCRRWMDST